ncbi:MAG: hypothetical protein HQL63_12385 [Magnetococcales bacterium]|nr:hypothetical protein [Magnetococcales bacterium]
MTLLGQPLKQAPFEIQDGQGEREPDRQSGDISRRLPRDTNKEIAEKFLEERQLQKFVDPTKRGHRRQSKEQNGDERFQADDDRAQGGGDLSPDISEGFGSLSRCTPYLQDGNDVAHVHALALIQRTRDGLPHRSLRSQHVQLKNHPGQLEERIVLDTLFIPCLDSLPEGCKPIENGGLDTMSR